MALNFDKSNNPMFNEKTLEKAASVQNGIPGKLQDASFKMTVNGAVNKSLTLGLILMCVAVFSYLNPSQLFIYLGVFGGAALYFFTSFKPHYASITAPIYAILKGLFVGSVSYMYAVGIEGIVFHAVSLTIATLLAMLMIYKSGIIKVTKSFRTGVTMAVAAVMIVYLISWVGHFVGFNIPYIHEGGTIGVGITVIILGIAALNLLLDFDNFDKGEAMGAPKFMEWYYAMGLLFTIVWLYIEFLRLISKLQRD